MRHILAHSALQPPNFCLGYSIHNCLIFATRTRVLSTGSACPRHIRSTIVRGPARSAQLKPGGDVWVTSLASCSYKFDCILWMRARTF